MSNTYLPLYGVYDTSTGALQGVCPVSGSVSSISGNPVSITGTPTVGSVLTATLATGWTASGYQWVRDVTPISGATSSTYTLISADSGHSLSVNASGLVYTPVGQSIAGATPVAPTVVSAPVVSSASTTAPLTWTAASFAGTPTPTVIYDVLVNGSVVASSATSGSYTPVTVGGSLVVRATATNSAGSIQSSSTPAVTITGSAVVPAGGMKTLTIADATPIDPVVAASGPSTGSAIGASGSGWTAIVVLKGITSLVGTCVPSALTLTVSDPGYDTSGNVTTVNRTITGVAQVRRQYPNGGSKMISTDGTDLTMYISLDDVIYTGTTIVSATIGSSFYTGCTAGNTGTTTSNLSATAYTKPVFAWFNVQEERVSTSTISVEAVAFHRHATAGQQVACVKYTATDGTTSSTTVTTSATQTSALQTQGNIAEVWAGTVTISGLTSALMCTVNAKVYPWLGDSSAVTDLSATGVTWPTTTPMQPLRFYNDRSGTYGGAYAYVQVGASGGTVSATAATARAAPFPTVTAAFSALVTWNNTSAGGHTTLHSDIGGSTVRLMDNAGAAQTHTVGGNFSQSGGATFCVIEADPLNTGAISYTWSSQSALPDAIMFRNVTFIAQAAGTSNYMLLGNNVARQKIALDKCTFDMTLGARSAATWISTVYLRNTTITGGRSTDFLNLAPSPNVVMNIGMTLGTAGSKTTSQASLTVGCVMPNFVYGSQGSTTDGDHGRIVYNNRFYRGTVINTSVTTINFGMANVQNLYEYDLIDTANISMNMFADADLTTITNYIEFHNTAVGERASRLYNDVIASKVAPNGTLKIGMSKYCIWDNYNIKTDTFNSNAAGSTGNWMYEYSCGNAGNVSLFGEVTRTTTYLPHNDNSPGPYLGAAWLPSSEPNLGQPANGLTQAQVMALFTSYTVAPQSTQVLGGDYTPKSTSTLLKNRVPAGKSVLKKDLAGLTRRSDGTGAAGAYESL